MGGQSIRVLVNGAKGRMGQETVKAVEAAGNLQLVGATDLADDMASEIGRCGAQVVVDFTQPDVAVENTRTILHAGACPVVGTTGFRAEQIEELQAQAAELKLGGIIAPNFAIGAVLLMKFAAEAARYFPALEVIELHHDKKLDAPSGTAVKTIEMIRESQPEKLPRNPEEKETVPGARGGEYLGVTVHSVRLPGFVAHEEVLFGGLGQVLSIRHDSISRESFMPGVVLAATKAPTLKKLHYGLETIL